MPNETCNSIASRLSRTIWRNSNTGYMLALTAFLAGTCSALASDVLASRQARVKDISSIEGIRDNQLVGYGIVVGLQGTGDSQQTTFPTQTLAATLLRMGVSVPASSIR